MTLKTPEVPVSAEADLFRSLGDSVQMLRQRAENLSRQIEAGEDADLGSGGKQLAQVEFLIRACQKVEVILVEHSNKKAGIAQGGYALDLVQARFDIGCRLARLRACHGSGDVSE